MQMITVLYDTETTGLIKPKATDISEQPYITEIYCLKVDHNHDGSEWEVLGEYDQMFNVPIPLDAIITKITGIDDAMLKDKPTFGSEAENLGKFFTGTDRIVAHNLAFDRSMLANELVRCDKVIKFPWPVDHVCTVEKSMHVEQRRLTLTKLHQELFNEGFPDAHRAKNDVLPLTRCYREMLKLGWL